MSSSIYLSDFGDTWSKVASGSTDVVHKYAKLKTLESLDLSTHYTGKIPLWPEFRKKHKRRLYVLNTLGIDFYEKIDFYVANAPNEDKWFKVLRALYKRNDYLDMSIFFRIESLQPVIIDLNFLSLFSEMYLAIVSSTDVSEAMKRYLKPLDLLRDYWKFLPHEPSMGNCYYLAIFLEILRESGVCSMVVVDLFKVYHKETHDYFSKIKNDSLDYVLSCLQKLKCDIFKIWSRKRNEACVLINTLDYKREYEPYDTFRARDILTVCMMVERFDICLLLIKYGVGNPTYYDEDYHLRNRIETESLHSKYSPRLSFFYGKIMTRNLYLALQVIFIKISSYKSDSAGISCRKLLKKLWRSIEDPLLIYRDFTYVKSHYCHVSTHFLIILDNAYHWYEKVVCDEQYDSMWKPRSLRHLSRCTIRRRLEENFSLPRGVDNLPLPKNIKDYLLLKKAKNLNWNMN